MITGDEKQCPITAALTNTVKVCIFCSSCVTAHKAGVCIINHRGPTGASCYSSEELKYSKQNVTFYQKKSRTVNLEIPFSCMSTCWVVPTWLSTATSQQGMFALTSKKKSYGSPHSTEMAPVLIKLKSSFFKGKNPTHLSSSSHRRTL